MVKPLPALAFGTPLEPMAGTQPREFVLAVQYVLRSAQSTIATVRVSHAETPAYRNPAGSAGTSHSPLWLEPQATAVPSLRRATVWKTPASISTYKVPLGSAGTSHWPMELSPHATTVPSLRRATVCA